MSAARFGDSGRDISRFAEITPGDGPRFDPAEPAEIGCVDENNDDITAEQWRAMTDDDALALIQQQWYELSQDRVLEMLEMFRAGRRVTTSDFPELR